MMAFLDFLALLMALILKPCDCETFDYRIKDLFNSEEQCFKISAKLTIDLNKEQ